METVLSPSALNETFEQVLSSSEGYERSWSITLYKWGYSKSEAIHEGRVELFLFMAETGRVLEKPAGFISRVLKNREISKARLLRNKLEATTKTGRMDFTGEERSKSKTALQIISELPEITKEQRDLLRLKFVYEKTNEEIANILGVRLGTVKSRLNRLCESFKPGSPIDQRC